MDDKTLKALGDPKRFQLLKIMSERGYCVSALAESTGLSESAVSQHLKILREADLVIGVKRGYYTHYSINKEAIENVIKALCELTNVKREPCSGPFYGCPLAQKVQCKSYVPPENRTKEEEKTC